MVGGQDQGGRAPTAWAELLNCEFHPCEVLAKVGLSVVGAGLIDSGRCRFLECPRFDCQGASGGLGVVSLEALSTLSVGLARDWNIAVGKLWYRGLIADDSLASVR